MKLIIFPGIPARADFFRRGDTKASSAGEFEYLSEFEFTILAVDFFFPRQLEYLLNVVPLQIMIRCMQQARACVRVQARRWRTGTAVESKSRTFSTDRTAARIQLLLSSSSCLFSEAVACRSSVVDSLPLWSGGVACSRTWSNLFLKSRHPWKAQSTTGIAYFANKSEEDQAMETVEAPTRSFQIVLAVSRNWGLGVNGDLPWHLPLDLKHFTKVTTETRSSSKRNAVVMGRKSWDALPKKYRPLKRRFNVVLSRTSKQVDDDSGSTVVCESVHSALTLLATPQYASEIETVFIIGGGQILRCVSKGMYAQG